MGFEKETGLFEQGGLFEEREELGGFVAVSGSEKAVVEGESFGSGEAAQFY